MPRSAVDTGMCRGEGASRARPAGMKAAGSAKNTGESLTPLEEAAVNIGAGLTFFHVPDAVSTPRRC